MVIGKVDARLLCILIDDNGVANELDGDVLDHVDNP